MSQAEDAAVNGNFYYLEVRHPMIGGGRVYHLPSLLSELLVLVSLCYGYALLEFPCHKLDSAVYGILLPSYDTYFQHYDLYFTP